MHITRFDHITVSRFPFLSPRDSTRLKLAASPVKLLSKRSVDSVLTSEPAIVVADRDQTLCLQKPDGLCSVSRASLTVSVETQSQGLTGPPRTIAAPLHKMFEDCELHGFLRRPHHLTYLRQPLNHYYFDVLEQGAVTGRGNVRRSTILVLSSQSTGTNIRAVDKSISGCRKNNSCVQAVCFLCPRDASVSCDDQSMTVNWPLAFHLACRLTSHAREAAQNGGSLALNEDQFSIAPKRHGQQFLLTISPRRTTRE